MQRLTQMLRARALLAFAAAALVAGSAQATSRIPRDEGFMRPPASVQNRTFSLDAKHDLAAFFTFSIQNQLTEHLGGALTWDYSFTEYVALDVLVAGGMGGLTSFAHRVRDTAKKGNSNAADLEDAGALLAHGSIGVRFTPAYGKLSLASELPLHFHAYVVGGIGGAFVNYNGVLACSTDLSGNKCPDGNFRSEYKPSPAVNFGGGFRFIIDQRFSARVEVRDVVYLDRWYNNVNLATPGSTPGDLESGFTHVPLVMVGVGFTL